MGSKELSASAVQEFMQERAEAWRLVEESVDPATGFVPMAVIDELLSRGGVGTIVAKDAMHFVDPVILTEEIKQEMENK